MAKENIRAKLIIAGPGAGKTHNMVKSIVESMVLLESSRYLVVITYTNSATNNIKKRLEKLIRIPENIFIGTMHSFLNKFIVIPFGSIGNSAIGKEKLFLQCGIKDVFDTVEKLKSKEKRTQTFGAAAKLKENIKNRLNEKGYITFDQTLSIAKDCMSNSQLSKILANRLQYIYIDEFQDSNNDIFGILESLRKHFRTTIYCVGDPEQYIQGFDSSIRAFSNIPILKASLSSGYDVVVNRSNFRSTQCIVKFLNHFNGRVFGDEIFSQIARSRGVSPDVEAELGEEVIFIQEWGTATPIVERFNTICDEHQIEISERFIIAKKNDLVKRIVAALNNQYMDPKKTVGTSPMKSIQDTLLTTLQMSQSQYCQHFCTDIYSLRQHVVAIYKAIKNNVVVNENTYAKFLSEKLGLEMKKGLPVKIENLKFDNASSGMADVMTVANIHTIKGMEAQAVLAIAKDEKELLLWIETDQTVRIEKRDKETKDYPRLGYVAFSRAEKILCIGCMQLISDNTKIKLMSLGVKIL